MIKSEIKSTFSSDLKPIPTLLLGNEVDYCQNESEHIHTTHSIKKTLRSASPFLYSVLTTLYATCSASRTPYKQQCKMRGILFSELACCLYRYSLLLLLLP